MGICRFIYFISLQGRPFSRSDSADGDRRCRYHDSTSLSRAKVPAQEVNSFNVSEIFGSSPSSLIPCLPASPPFPRTVDAPAPVAATAEQGSAPLVRRQMPNDCLPGREMPHRKKATTVLGNCLPPRRERPRRSPGGRCDSACRPPRTAQGIRAASSMTRHNGARP